MSSASRDLLNYHFTLLAVISSTPLSLVNKLETMYWRGANKSHCFIQKSQDSIWTLASSFIHTPRNKAWGDIHCISAILYMNSISMRSSQSYSWHLHNLVLHQWVLSISHTESRTLTFSNENTKVWNGMSHFRIEVGMMQFIHSDFET